jgi:hypothetical protein
MEMLATFRKTGTLQADEEVALTEVVLDTVTKSERADWITQKQKAMHFWSNVLAIIGFLLSSVEFVHWYLKRQRNLDAKVKMDVDTR